ncbi:MAG: DNA primase [Aquabacterium sp.]|nr:MAG: DNA primase [Aquabacterium sp.]
MIPAGFIQDLLARVDIVEIVGRHVQLRRGGANYMGLCPFHGEKSPSFSVSPSKQFYHCFGCGAHGNAIGFLMEHTGAGFVEAVEDLAQQCGLQVPQDERTAAQREREREQKDRRATLSEVLARASAHYRKQLKASPKAIDYLKGRGLTGEIAAHFGIGYAPDGWRSLAGVFPQYDDPLLAESGLVIVQEEDGQEAKRYDRFRDRITFPIRSVQGQVIGFGGRVIGKGEPKYLNSPETPVFVKGHELYGLYEARTAMREKGYALVVEGYMDVVALAQWGFPNAVATLGTACTEEHVHKLFRFTERVVFSFDGDAAGRRAAARALEAALPHARDTRRISFLFLPPEHDPDSYIREFGPEAFEEQVTKAVPLSRQLLEQAAHDCDLELPEGRATLVAAAKPLIARLPEGNLRTQITMELATLARLPAEELQRSVGAAPSGDEPAGYDAPPDDSYAGYTGYEDYSAGAEHDGGQRQRGPRWERGNGRSQRGGKGDWKDWKNRKDRPPVQPPMPMAASLLDRAAWMLIQQSDLWDGLSDAEHEMLVGQGEPYGSFFTWLDRLVHDQGAMAREAMLEALQRGAADEAADPVEREALAGLRSRVAGFLPMDIQAAAQLEIRRVLTNLELNATDEELGRLTGMSEHSPDMKARLRELLGLRQQLKTRLDELRAQAPGGAANG